MTAGSKKLGSGGEAIVRSFLEARGWSVLAMNYRCKAGEIDLIAEEPSPDGVVLAFVEVKTRAGMGHGSPAEAVDARKQRAIAAVAAYYLGARGAGGAEPACRFDVAEVLFGRDGLATVTLHKAAFQPES